MTSIPIPDDDLRIGIALSSGGAAGLAHVGVLEELTAAGLRISQVAGTSAGAIVGAAFAAQQLDAFRDRMMALTRRGRIALFDPIWPRTGIFAGYRAMALLRPFVGHTIEALPTRYAAVATDLHAGCSVVLTRGNVIDAVRASMAIPGLFTPVHLQGRLLVDGALTDPLPVGPVRDLGAEFVIAVNVIPAKVAAHVALAPQPSSIGCTVRRWLSSLEGWSTAQAIAQEAVELPEECKAFGVMSAGGLMDILSQASAVVQAHLVAARLRDQPPDICIAPEVGEVGLFDLHRAADAIDAGRAAARAILPQLSAAIQSAQRRRRGATRPGLRQVFSKRVRLRAAA